MKRLQVNPSPEITVTFDPNVCEHSGVCVRSLPAVFDVKRARWIDVDAATADQIAHTIDRCPSGALKYYRNTSQDPDAATRLKAAIDANTKAIADGPDAPPDER